MLLDFGTHRASLGLQHQKLRSIAIAKAWLPSSMAPPYSNGFSSAFSKSRYEDSSLVDDFRAFLARIVRLFWRFAKGRGRRLAIVLAMDAVRQFRRNLVTRRLLSFPHALVAVWIFVLLWGERWVFHSRVEQCHWSDWENWVSCPRLGY